jgi:hypothetical protein
VWTPRRAAPHIIDLATHQELNSPPLSLCDMLRWIDAEQLVLQSLVNHFRNGNE